MSIAVDRVWCDAARIAPDRGAAGCVRDIETIAEELGEQARVLRFCATSAGTGELEQRLLELAGFDVGRTGKLGLLGDVGDAVVEDLLLRKLVLDGHHRERITRAGGYADAAAHAIERTDGQRVLEAGFLGLLAVGIEQLHVGGSRRDFGGVEREGPDGSVWADIGAIVALNADLGIPTWNRDGNATFLVGRNAQLELAIRMVYEG